MEKVRLSEVYRFSAGEDVPDWALRIEPKAPGVVVTGLKFKVDCDVVCYADEVAFLPHQSSEGLIELLTDCAPGVGVTSGTASAIRLGKRARLFTRWSEVLGEDHG